MPSIQRLNTWYAAPTGALTFVNERTADYLGLPKDHPFGSELHRRRLGFAYPAAAFGRSRGDPQSLVQLSQNWQKPFRHRSLPFVGKRSWCAPLARCSVMPTPTQLRACLSVSSWTGLLLARLLRLLRRTVPMNVGAGIRHEAVSIRHLDASQRALANYISFPDDLV